MEKTMPYSCLFGCFFGTKNKFFLILDVSVGDKMAELGCLNGFASFSVVVLRFYFPAALFP